MISRTSIRTSTLLVAAGVLSSTALLRADELAAISPDRIRSHVEYLASDELEGRDSGEPGLEVAAEYVARRFQEVGLEPAGDDGRGYFNAFTVPHGADFGRVIGAAVTSPGGREVKLEAGSEVLAFGYGETAGPVDAPVVFAGYGITADDEDRKAGLDYDDYSGIDVRGKVAVILRYTPRSRERRDRSRGADQPFGGRDGRHAPLAAKLRNAREHGAAGVILVTPPRAEGAAPDAQDDLWGLAHRASPRQPTLPALLASRSVVDDWLRPGGKDLAGLAREIDEALRPRSFEIPSLRIRFDTTPGHRVLRNVVGRIPGRGKLATESVVIGAHYDHIGRYGDQVASKNLGQVHNGADDNASGTAGLIELSRALRAGLPASGEGSGDSRSFIFIAFSGEEIGLLGSRAWLDEPRRFRAKEGASLHKEPDSAERSSIDADEVLEGGREHRDGWVEVIRLRDGARGWMRAQELARLTGPEPVHDLAAMLNLDMIGRARSGAALSVISSDSSPDFKALLAEASKKVDVEVAGGGKTPGVGGSDHASFLGREIPVLFFFTGMHSEYNTPQDDPPTLNYEGEARILELVREVALRIATAPARPVFDRQALAAGGAAHGRPKLGVRFEPDVEGAGVRVLEVVADTPAAKGGILAGDVILSFGGASIRSPGDLTRAVEDARPGEELPVKIERGGMEMSLKVLFPERTGGFRVVFGSIPDYSFAEKGVRFEGIRPGTPAEKAGVKPGDVLIRWGEKEVEDVESWTALLGKQKPGDVVPIRVRRGTEEIGLEVKLEGRE